MRRTVFVALALAGALTEAAPFDVRDFGAKGDGVTKDTAAIQAAIDAAEKAGGGEVFLGAGTYLSGSIYLKDNIDFHLGPGATLLGSDNPLDYSDPYCYPLNNPIWPSESSFGAHLVVCYERKNVTVRGPGKIDGNAKAFLVSPEGKVYWQGAVPWRPSQMLWFCQSEDVRVTDLEIANSTYWSCFFHGCDRVMVRGCRVHNNRHRRGTFHTHNGDGIDVDSCRWVSISDCDIDVADDGITLRASPSKGMRNRECAYVTVSNCRISSECNAVRVGVGNGRIHDAVFSNLSVYETRLAFNFASSWRRGSHGCDFADIRFENCALDCGRFLCIDPIYSTEATVRNISFSGLTGKSYLPGRIYWNDPKLCGRILLRDVDLGCGIMCKNAPEVEIAGGALKRVDFPADEATKREWEVADWGGYSDWGECGHSKYAGRKWKLVWSDEFDGTELDRTKWNVSDGVVSNPGTEHLYTASTNNVRVENGRLLLEARRETVANPNYRPGSSDIRHEKERKYTSGLVDSSRKFEFTYGRVEARAKVPPGRGMWPAVWMLGANFNPNRNWPYCGELDVMEWVGSDPGTVFGTMHWYDPVHAKETSKFKTVSFGQRLVDRTPADGFHVYAVEWDRDEIVFYYDDVRYFSYDVNLATLREKDSPDGEYNPFRRPMYLILNLALGGGWAGKVDPACMPGAFEIDYVRVYRLDD